jgi:hypothetical protein
MQKLIVAVLIGTALFIAASCGGSGAEFSPREGDPGVLETTPSATAAANAPEKVPEASIGEKIEIRGEDGKVTGEWIIHSAIIESYRSNVYNGKRVEGPILTLDVSFTNRDDKFAYVFDDHLAIYTNQTIHASTSMEESYALSETYGRDENGEWRTFGEQLAPDASERGLILLKLAPEEEPKSVVIFDDSTLDGSTVQSTATATASVAAMADWAEPVAKVDLTNIPRQEGTTATSSGATSTAAATATAE